MSPASYLTAPPRVAIGIIPPVDFFLFLSLLVFVVAVSGATIVLVRRALTLYYDVQRLLGGADAGVAAILARAAAAPTHLQAAAESGERLARSVTRLRSSLAGASVLRAALQDTLSPVRRVRRAVRK